MKSGVTLQQMLTEVKRQSESKEDSLPPIACGWNPTAKKCFCTCQTTAAPS